MIRVQAGRFLASTVGSFSLFLRIVLVHDGLIHARCHAEVFVHLEHVPVALIEISCETHRTKIKVGTL
jgi:hypothetical protein